MSFLGLQSFKSVPASDLKSQIFKAAGAVKTRFNFQINIDRSAKNLTID